LAIGFGHGGVSAAIAALTLATLAFGLTSVFGIWETREWSFFAFYPFGALFTVLLGASFNPFVTLLLLVDGRVAGVIVLNGAVLLLVTSCTSTNPEMGGQ